MIGINIGSQLTKFSVSEILPEKNKNDVYHSKDFKLNQKLNDFVDRVFPSIIQFRENDRLIGESTKLGYKKYYLSTFNHLSRLIGYIYPIEINEYEIEYFINDDNYENGNFEFKLNGKNFKISGDYCVCAFINEIDKKIKNKLNTNEKQKYIFSIPDYYTCYQKEALKLILKSLNLNNNYPFINESTAITMYYGYINYFNFKDTKYVIFIDVGHSKTSFILSKFNEEEFEVIKVENILFFGGRNLNEIIYDECLKEFKRVNGRDMKITGRNTIRLMEEIEKLRKNLSINDEAQIVVESIDDNIDFEFTISQTQFYKFIKAQLRIFEKKFREFYNEVSKKYEIYKIEMGGQLMRTPLLQEKVFDISGMNISKTISLDECHSFGTLLYATFILENKKYEKLKSVKSHNMYSINYTLYSQIFRPLIIKNENIPFKTNIKYKRLKDNIDEIYFYLSYDKTEFNDISLGEKDDDYILYEYIFDNRDIKEYLKNENINENENENNKYGFVRLNIKINESNEIEFEYVLSNGKTFEAKIKEDSGFIYNKYNKDIINRFREYENFYEKKK